MRRALPAFFALLVVPAMQRIVTVAAPPAHVRFANQITSSHTWSLKSNGTFFFREIASNTTTGYLATTDSVSKLTLHRDAGDSIFASTNYNFVGGSYYTVTASYGSGERPFLAVQRDTPPRDTMP